MADIQSDPKSQERVARFEAARAVLRPRQCDNGARCWVRRGACDLGGLGGAANFCAGCRGKITVAGVEHEHQRALLAIIRQDKPAFHLPSRIDR